MNLRKARHDYIMKRDVRVALARAVDWLKIAEVSAPENSQARTHTTDMLARVVAMIAECDAPTTEEMFQ